MVLRPVGAYMPTDVPDTSWVRNEHRHRVELVVSKSKYKCALRAHTKERTYTT